jgi:ribosomal protein L37AE/L43A
MGWIEDAWKRGELKITEKMQCPICNPTMATNKETAINACEKHQWASEKWLEATYDIRKRSS